MIAYGVIGGSKADHPSRLIDHARWRLERLLMPVLRQKSGCARFHRSCSRLVTLARWAPGTSAVELLTEQTERTPLALYSPSPHPLPHRDQLVHEPPQGFGDEPLHRREDDDGGAGSEQRVGEEVCDRVQQLRLPRLSEFPADGGDREDQREGEDDVPGRLVAEKFNGGLWLLRVGGKEVVLLVALEV